ncbi:MULTISPECIES: hypothetical protein [unclassified Xanthomonas]|uniref:hypothetical protein n=1 Tax=unclassified Xanthomonas TaxID=2643310 RepID=UPI00288B7C4D|nr:MULTISPECIES: hypothetical protein [unclassified Xanthomonas]
MAGQSVLIRTARICRVGRTQAHAITLRQLRLKLVLRKIQITWRDRSDPLGWAAPICLICQRFERASPAYFCVPAGLAAARRIARTSMLSPRERRLLD